MYVLEMVIDNVYIVALKQSLMFWNKKKKLPITKEDKIWVDEDLNWLKTELGQEHFMEIRTVTPTKDFYDRTFDGTEKDAEFILERTMDLMNIRDTEIKLEFFSDEPVITDDGAILSTPADINGSWKSASGIYQQTENDIIIISSHSGYFSAKVIDIKEPSVLILGKTEKNSSSNLNMIKN